MAKSLDELKQQLQARLDELGPLVDEHRQLERAAAALGIARAAPAPAPARDTAAPVAKRAPRGANKAAILAAIGERPGATVSEIADATGLAKPLIYNATRAGVEQGDLETVDLGGGRKGFRPAGGDADAEPETSLVEATEGIEDPDSPPPVGG